MPDLKQQLRTYFEVTATAIEPPEIVGQLFERSAGPHSELRSLDMHTIERPSDQAPPPPRRRWRGPAAAAIATVVLAVVGAIVLTRGGDATQTPEPAGSVPVSESVETFGDESAAIQLATQYYEAFNQGDLTAMTDMLADDADITGVLGSSFEQVMAWDIAQGSTVIDPVCRTQDSADVSRIRVICELDHHPYLAQIAGGPATNIVATIEVSDDGEISFYNERIVADPLVEAIEGNFSVWLERSHVDDVARVQCCEWESVEDAAAGGTLRAQYADEYAIYIEQQGCLFEEPCE